MPPRRGTKIDRAQHGGRRDHQHGNDRKGPEHIDVSEEVDLLLQGPSDPGDSLRGRIARIRALGLEVARHRLDGLLVAEVGGRGVLDQAALMELLALRRPISATSRPSMR